MPCCVKTLNYGNAIAHVQGIPSNYQQAKKQAINWYSSIVTIRKYRYIA